jgi:uncharacterized membrane protein YkvA (DUF1232 family)
MPAAKGEARQRETDETQKLKDNIRYTIVTMTALVCKAYLCYTYLPSKWALPLTLILDGFFYLMSPLDIIPDDWMYGNLPLGKLDDYIAIIIAAVGCVILYMRWSDSREDRQAPRRESAAAPVQCNENIGQVQSLPFGLCLEINSYLAPVDWPELLYRVPEGGPVTYCLWSPAKSRLEFANVKRITVYNLSLLLLVLSCWFVEKARFFYIGIHAFFSTPLAIFAILSGNWAIGASVVAVALIYYLLPFSLAMFFGEQQNFNMIFLALAIGCVIMYTAHVQGTPVLNSEPWIPAVFSEAARTIRPAGVKAEL